MTSKSQILDSIRQRRLQEVALPSLDHPWFEYEDRQRQFGESVRGVGGECVIVDDLDGLNRRLNQLPVYAEARQIVSTVPGAGRPTVDLAAIDDPHDLQDVEFAILPGLFGVAENGAVWITDEGLNHRVIYFIAQHMAIVLSRSELVDNMHQAYRRLASVGADRWAPGRGVGFGAFVSGPSKTADIEQSLVIGAHGARSLTVFLVDSLAAGDLSPQVLE